MTYRDAIEGLERRLEAIGFTQESDVRAFECHVAAEDALSLSRRLLADLGAVQGKLARAESLARWVMATRPIKGSRNFVERVKSEKSELFDLFQVLAGVEGEK